MCTLCWVMGTVTQTMRRSNRLTHSLSFSSCIYHIMEGSDPENVSDAGINERVIARRFSQHSRQVFFGKTTVGYNNYIRMIPHEEKASGHPVTPRFDPTVSKRSATIEIRCWRRALHRWDSEIVDNFPPSVTYVAQPPTLPFVHQPYAL